MANIKTNSASNIKEEDNQPVKKETSNPMNVKKELTDHTDLDSNSDNDINIKDEENTSFIQNRHHYPGPVECIVYWDYYTHPIPKAHNLGNIITTLKQNICNKIGSKPIQFRIYSTSNSIPNLRPKLQDEFDINGINEINVSHHTSIANRLIIDISLKLHESEKHKKSNCIGVISQDKEIAHLLSRIHKEPAISNSFIISFDSNTIHPSSNNVDFVLTIDSISNTQKTAQKHINNSNNSLKRKRKDTHASHLNKFNTNTKPIIIMIQKLGAVNNKKFPLIVLPNDTIKQVKLKMHENEIDTLKRGACISIHTLFNDRKLDNKDIISACGIKNGNTIHWKPVETVSVKPKRVSKPISILLQKFGSYNNKRFKLSVLLSDSMKQVKVKMRKIIHAQFNVVSFNGRILVDNDIVGVCGIGSGDMIHWNNEVIGEPKRKKMKWNEDKWEFRKFGYIDIILKDMKTKQYGKFHVSPDDTIHDIRLLMGRSIYELRGVDCSEMVLMFGRVDLSHIYYPLSWYNIKNGDIIEWQMKEYINDEREKNKNKNYSMQVITDTASATLEIQMPKLEAEFV